MVDEGLLQRVQLVGPPPCLRWCRSRPPRPRPPAPGRNRRAARSAVTVQAPQSPVPQPSLAPVRSSWLRRTSSSVSPGSVRELDGIAVDGGGDVNGGSFHGLRLGNRRSWRRGGQERRPRRCGTRRCRACRRWACRRPRRPWPGGPARRRPAWTPMMRRGGSLDQQHDRRDGAQRHAGGGDRAGRVQHQVDAGRADGNVHFGAGDEAQIGVARFGRTRRQQDRGDELALGQLVLPGADGDCPAPAHRARPWAQRRAPRHPPRPAPARESPAGEALHRLPAMVARPWTCVEPIRLAASTTPGQAATRSLSSPKPGSAPRRRCGNRRLRA